MAKSASGKWVSRVGATGGGKAYKKTRPGNYYGVLALIVIFGLLAAVWARYDYQHPAKALHATAPAIGTTWYAALSIQACGATLPYLTSNASSSVTGFAVLADNVIRISPTSAADAGNNATVSQFADEYPGLTASSGEIAVPTAKDAVDAATTYHNGAACAAKTKYAGQTGKIEFAYWKTISQVKPTITTNPAAIKFGEYMRVTMAFEPTGVTPTAPSTATVDEMVKLGTTATTTTTLATTTTTTATTTTTKAGTTTTTPPTTTTTKG
ncbi:MAG: hypothetical protein ABSG24_10690 [Acidimicrobiales bacterium]